MLITLLFSCHFIKYVMYGNLLRHQSKQTQSDLLQPHLSIFSDITDRNDEPSVRSNRPKPMHQEYEREYNLNIPILLLLYNPNICRPSSNREVKLDKKTFHFLIFYFLAPSENHTQQTRLFMMLGGPSIFFFALLITWCCMTGRRHGVYGQRKTSCRVQGDSADCSHLSLTSIPQDLPRNLTSLDVSHNRLRGIPPESLRPYPDLCHLSISYNSVTKLEGRLCETLPRLQTLDVAHNQILGLREEDLSRCSGLTALILASNRLKLQGEPFSGLQVPNVPHAKQKPFTANVVFGENTAEVYLNRLYKSCREISCKTSENIR